MVKIIENYGFTHNEGLKITSALLDGITTIILQPNSLPDTILIEIISPDCIKITVVGTLGQKPYIVVEGEDLEVTKKEIFKVIGGGFAYAAKVVIQ